MRHLIIFCTLFLSLGACAQDTFVLNGSVSGRDTGRIVLGYFNPQGKWFMDTAYLDHGQFTFRGPVHTATKVTLWILPQRCSTG